MLATRREMADLGRFSQLLEETEHFCGRGQEKVAKIVQCGEPFYFCRCLERKILPDSVGAPWHN
jgi:hypothetical protein